jgi:hypothetical protein
LVEVLDQPGPEHREAFAAVMSDRGINNPVASLRSDVAGQLLPGRVTDGGIGIQAVRFRIDAAQIDKIGVNIGRSRSPALRDSQAPHGLKPKRAGPEACGWHSISAVPFAIERRG